MSTAKAMGWAELENGELLAAAESAGFDVMVTGDKNLSYQQNLSERRLALVVLSTNNWNVIKQKTETILEVINEISRSDFIYVAL